MKQFLVVVGLLLLLFLGILSLFEGLEAPLLTDPGQWMAAPNPAVALAGIGLLILDVILPIPASLVMITNGALFGVVLGSLLSLIGGMGAALCGYWLRRFGEPWLIRSLSPTEYLRIQRLLQQWGLLALILTRPVPLLAETTVIVAGAMQMNWRSLSVGALVSLLPTAVLYALTGALAINLNGTWLTFALILGVAGLFWLVGKWLIVEPTSADAHQKVN